MKYSPQLIQEFESWKKEYKKSIIAEIEKKLDLCPPSDGVSAGCSYCKNKPENKTLKEIINIIKS